MCENQRDHALQIYDGKENLRTNGLKDYATKNGACMYDLNGLVDGHKSRLQICLSQSNLRKSYVRYSESENDNQLIKAKDIVAIKSRIRARCESEPNDIRNLQYFPTSTSGINQRPKCNPKSLEENSISEKTINQSSIIQKKSNNTALRKKESPRILVYNNSPRVNSPVLLKKVMRHRAQPVLGSPRMNRVRQYKIKSPQTTNSSTPHIKSNLSHRKQKLMATTQRQISMGVNNRQLISKNVSSIYKVTDSESSFEENEDGLVDEVSDVSERDSGDVSVHSKLDYKMHAYAKNNSSRYSLIIKNTPLKGRETAHFVTSLFPNVPPYLSFCSHIAKRPPMPLCLNNILKWKLTTVMPKIIRCILINSGFRLLKKTNDWMGTWGKHMKSPCFKTVRAYQKFNHIPGSFKIGRKDSCWRNLQAQMLKHGDKGFGFMPKTYILPQDLKILRRTWTKYSQRNCKWIVKPPASARGTGIKVINRWSQIPKRKPVIVQRYIEKPFLINGSKFDLRLYVLVTSINPLRVYIYQDGLVRFASVKYSENPDTLNDRYMHLTNYSINKLSSTYSPNEDVNACKGHKWTIKSLWSYLKRCGIDTNKLWSSLCNMVLRTLLAGENSINAMFKLNVESKYNCYELFGFDVILDSDLTPWLLEVNISPSLHSELPLDLHVKGPLVQAVLNTALYHVPPKLSLEHQKQVLTQEGLTGPLCYDKRMYITYLSKEEKIKHNLYTRKISENRTEYLNSILDNLTPDDVRCLIVSEDELQRSAPLERIFPTLNTFKYLKYTELPRYYNFLLNAWEQKYHRNRHEGVAVLQELCKQKFHLLVPSQPVRKEYVVKLLRWIFKS